MEKAALSRLVKRFSGELATIVLGILFALWIDGLVAARADRRLEAAYLSSLEEDLVADSAALVAALASAERQESAATGVLDTLRNQAQPSPAFLMLLFAAGETGQYQPRDLTLEELRTTGNLRLVRNRELVRHLIQYYGLATLSRSDEDMRIRAVTRYLDLAESVVGGGLGNPTVVRRMLEGNTGFTLEWSPPPFPIAALRGVQGLDPAMEGVFILALGDKERFQTLVAENRKVLSLLRD